MKLIDGYHAVVDIFFFIVKISTRFDISIQVGSKVYLNWLIPLSTDQ